MTSTSSSPNGASFALELTDERGEAVVFPLVDAARGETTLGEVAAQKEEEADA